MKETIYDLKKENDAYIEELENKLEQTIAGMEGAGNVNVMITLKDNGEKILDKNQPYESEKETSSEEQKVSEQEQQTLHRKTEKTGTGRRITGVALANGSILKADALIVATGGISYPSTGATGSRCRYTIK